MSFVSSTERDGVADLTDGRALLLVGFVVWLVATLAFHFVGDQVIAPDGGLATLAIFAGTAVLVAVLAYAVYSWLGVADAERPRAAALLVIPGMALDVGALVGFAVVFPRIDPAVTAEFAALVVLSYVVVLLTGFLPRHVADVGEEPA